MSPFSTSPHLGRRSHAAFIVAAACASAGLPVWGQLRIVQYNTAEGARTGIRDVFEAIGNESVNGIARPIDVLALEEQATNGTTLTALLAELNGLYGAGAYAKGTLVAQSTGAGSPGIIYRTSSVQLVGEASIGVISSTGMARLTLRYQVRPVGYDSQADFYLYVSHLKSSNTTTDAKRRGVEVDQIRANADALGAGKSIIYAGDLNLYSSSEVAYTKYLAAGNGQAFDPINTPGSWSGGTAFKAIHTQAPATGTHYAGQIVGGMNDRFDFQLISSALRDGEGMSYIGTGVANLHISPTRQSYRTFGNDGSHTINKAITTGTGASPAILAALESVTDHLPVVADYQLPARMGVTLASYPSRVIRGTATSVSLTVSNTAAVGAAIGADELDYSVTASGGVSGSTTGTDNPLGTGNSHSITLDTSVAGSRSGAIVTSALSAQVPTSEATNTQNLAWQVLEHATPSLSGTATVGAMVLDFGLRELGSTSQLAATLANRQAGTSATAMLDLDDILASGSTQRMTLSASAQTGIVAGGSYAFQASFGAATEGDFSATYTLRCSDENIPGASSPLSQSVQITLQGRSRRAQWLASGPANWSSAGNWLGTVPSGTATARFLGYAGVPGTVVLDQNVSIAGIEFSGTNGHVLSGTNTLTLASPSGASLTSSGSHSVSAPLVLGSDLTAGISDSLVLAATLTGPGRRLSKQGPGTLAINQATLGPVAISEGVIQLAGSGSLSATSLDIAVGAGLVLETAPLVVDYTGATPLTAMAAAVRDSRIAHGLADPGGMFAIGLIEASDLDVTNWRGMPVDSTSVLVAATTVGDADLNGTVDLDDLFRLIDGFGVGAGDWAHGDFDYNGTVDLDDLFRLIDGYVAAPLFPAAPVPEPTSIVLLAGSALLVRRRGRTR